MFLAWQWIALILLAILGGAVAVFYQRRAEAVADRVRGARTGVTIILAVTLLYFVI